MRSVGAQTFVKVCCTYSVRYYSIVNYNLRSSINGIDSPSFPWLQTPSTTDCYSLLEIVGIIDTLKVGRCPTSWKVTRKRRIVHSRRSWRDCCALTQIRGRYWLSRSRVHRVTSDANETKPDKARRNEFANVSRVHFTSRFLVFRFVSRPTVDVHLAQFSKRSIAPTRCNWRAWTIRFPSLTGRRTSSSLTVCHVYRDAAFQRGKTIFGTIDDTIDSVSRVTRFVNANQGELRGGIASTCGPTARWNFWRAYGFAASRSLVLRVFVSEFLFESFFSRERDRVLAGKVLWN